MIIQSEELLIRVPTMEDKEQILKFKEEFSYNPQDLCGSGSIQNFATFEDWFEKIQNCSKEETLPTGYVPATQFITIRKSDNKIVGMLNVRHYLNEKLLLKGGHIGDCVCPSERGKGYATKQIALALEFCKQLGLEKALITCNGSNIASAKTIIKNNGILENEIEVDGELCKRFWISL